MNLWMMQRDGFGLDEELQSLKCNKVHQFPNDEIPRKNPRKNCRNVGENATWLKPPRRNMSVSLIFINIVKST